MKFARSLTTVAAATTLAFGAVIAAPTAGASDIKPEQIQGDATPSDVSALDIYAELEQYLPKDEAGQPSPSRAEYEAAIGTNKTFDKVKIADLPDAKNWMGYVLKYPDYRARIKPLKATSPAMDGREVPLAVITPDGTFDESRPTLYLLNGAGGAQQGMDWLSATAGKDLDPKKDGTQDIDDYYADRGVNVVIPQAGAFSYYTDWVTSPDRGYLKGPQKWETFLTKELPGALEKHIGGNGKRAIAGMSMSATSSLLLAEHNPGFYNAVGSFSGCASTSRPLPRLYTQLTVNRGGGSADQMWGAMGSEYNVYNDALVNATPKNLGPSETYVSVNSGLGGANDWGAKGSSTLIVEGGVIEAAMSSCTHDLKAKMDSQGMKADWNFRNTGTHSWPGWRDDIFSSWKTFERGFNKDAAEAPAEPEVKPNELSIDAPQAQENAQIKDAPSAADQSPDKDFVEGKEAEAPEAAGAAE